MKRTGIAAGIHAGYLKRKEKQDAFVHLRSLFGNTWAMYYVLLGARQAGKSYAVEKLGLNSKRRLGNKCKWYWLRLTEASSRKLLQNDAKKLIDPDLQREFNVKLSVKNNEVYDTHYSDDDPLVTVLNLSTFYSDKGSSYFDKDFDGEYIVVLDEMNREKSEKNTFDIVYNFKNQLENLIRNSGSKKSKAKRVMVILIGNTLSEASDLLLSFKFIPNPGEFGRYYLRKKRCVIEYLPLSQAYKDMREGSAVDILESSDESTFTNEVAQDSTNIVGNIRLTYPSTVIKFKDDKNSWFTVWENGVVERYNGEQLKSQIYMRRYLQGGIYIKEQVDNVYQMFDAGVFKFRSFYTRACFKKELQLLKPQK